MFIQARILACIEKLKDAAKEVESFEDPKKMSVQHAIRTRRILSEVKTDVVVIRANIMNLRQKRIANGDRKY